MDTDHPVARDAVDALALGVSMGALFPGTAGVSPAWERMGRDSEQAGGTPAVPGEEHDLLEIRVQDAGTQLVRTFHLLDQLRGFFQPFLAVVTEPDSFKHYLATDTDHPVARDAVDALALGVSLAQQHRERVLVLFHKRFDLADLFVRVERQNEHVLSIFHLLTQLLHVRQLHPTRTAPRGP